MARKQETSASTGEANDTVSTVDSSSGSPETTGSPLSPGAGLVPASTDSGNSAVPAGATGHAEGTGLVPPEGQAVAGTAPDVVAGDQGASAGTVASDEASQAGPTLADSRPGSDQLATEEQAELNPSTLQIYPLRSYMDEGELRRRGGPAYTVPRRHAEELVQRNLASLNPLKE